MRRFRKIIVCLLSALLIALTFTSIVSANSAEPPGVTVIVSLPPDDLCMSIRLADGNVTDVVELRKEQKAWESYYRFFYHDLYALYNSWFSVSLENATLIISSSEKSFEILLPKITSGTYYNGFVTLDFKNETVTAGQSLVRSILLVAMRVIATLIIEGLIFFLFRYRKKASWALFIIVNLLTQTFLNIMLSGPGPNLQLSYQIFGLIILEILIFAFEAFMYVQLLNEHTKKWAICYALAANYASFALGWAFLRFLPV